MWTLPKQLKLVHLWCKYIAQYTQVYEADDLSFSLSEMNLHDMVEKITWTFTLTLIYYN